MLVHAERGPGLLRSVGTGSTEFGISWSPRQHLSTSTYLFSQKLRTEVPVV